jgi:hypothetical protein
MGQEETTGKNRIMIYRPKTDGTYIIKFKTAAGEALKVRPETSSVSPSTSSPARNGAFLCRGARHYSRLAALPA